MDAFRMPDGRISLRMSEAEVVVLHEVIAYSEWSNDLGEIELRGPVEQKVMSEVQQSLDPLIPLLGTDQYQQTLDEAYAAVDPRPF